MIPQNADGDKQVKDIFIFGPSRSGKTTLAGIISEKFGHRVISVDQIVSFFSSTYPELAINFATPESQTGKNMMFFVDAIYRAFKEKSPNNAIVIEGDRLDIRCIFEKYGNEAVFIGLAHDTIDAAGLVRIIRENDADGDWTRWFSDENLVGQIGNILLYSDWLVEKYQELKIPYYRTTHERNGTMEIILEFLKTRRDAQHCYLQR